MPKTPPVVLLLRIGSYLAVFAMGMFWDGPWDRDKIVVYIVGPFVIGVAALVAHLERRTFEPEA
ncbi:MAG: hypothetical protein ABIQ41_05410 [Gemmatimonadales bacterium]